MTGAIADMNPGTHPVNPGAGFAVHVAQPGRGEARGNTDT